MEFDPVGVALELEQVASLVASLTRLQDAVEMSQLFFQSVEYRRQLPSWRGATTAIKGILTALDNGWADRSYYQDDQTGD